MLRIRAHEPISYLLPNRTLLALLSFEIPAGTYSVRVATHPNGVDVRWAYGECKGGTFMELTTSCKLTGPSTLTITNPSVWELGSAEVVTLSVFKGRDPSAIETSSPGR